jgi:hypothetical protein
VDLGPAGVFPRRVPGGRRARLAPVGGLSGCRAVSAGEAARHPSAAVVAGRLDGQLAVAVRWRAMRAMPLAHCVICAAGRYAVPFAVWSTMGEARKASRPCGSMK